MSKQFVHTNIALLENALELAQGRGAFDLSTARIIFISLQFLKKDGDDDKNVKFFIQNNDAQIDKVAAARNLKQGLAQAQQKGNVGNMQTVIRLKQAADALIQVHEDREKTKEANAESTIFTPEDILQSHARLNLADKDALVKPLRQVTEAGQLRGFILLDALEYIETALRFLERCEMAPTEHDGLMEALKLMTVVCNELQMKGGVVANLTSASDLLTSLTVLARQAESLQSNSTAETQPEQHATEMQHSDSMDHTPDTNGNNDEDRQAGNNRLMKRAREAHDGAV